MLIIKVGGGHTISIERIAEDLVNISEPYIIVHGANSVRDELAERLQKPRRRVTSISGYSSVLSDQDTIDLQMMAYAGLRNKRFVELLQQQGIAAVGLSGLDGAVIRGQRNPGIRVLEDGKRKMIRDLSGKPKNINKPFLDLLLQHGYVPVLTVPILDETGVAINSENDDIVALLQEVFQARCVLHLLEAPGFLADVADESTLIAQLSRVELLAWEQRSEGRIKRKLLAIKRLFDTGVEQVIVADGRSKNPVTAALAGQGTLIH